MNARRVNAAAGVICAAQKTKQTPTGIAAALEAACLLQSPETAAEMAQLNEDVTGACLARWEEEQDNARLRLALASAKRGRADVRGELYGEQAQHRTVLEQRNAHAKELKTLRARVAELEAARTTAAADRDAQIIAWLAKKAGEEGTSNKDSRVRATAIYRMADKLSRGAVRPACPPVTAASPWERAVAGLNALVDAGVAFHVEPDGHISAPFSDEHIEWDIKARRWVLTHDDEDEGFPPLPGALAEQRHLMDPLDHVLEHLADERPVPEVPR